MLAGEPFSDHPAAVSPVIGALLRGYNDLVDDRRRQRLLRYASAAVGTATCREVEEARLRRLIEWADERWREQPLAALVGVRFGSLWSRRAHPDDVQSAGLYAIRSIHHYGQREHRKVLELLDELIAIGVATKPLGKATCEEAPSELTATAQASRSPSGRWSPRRRSARLARASHAAGRSRKLGRKPTAHRP